ALVETPLPLALDALVLLLAVAADAAVAPLRGEVRAQPGPDLVAERLLFGREAQIHGSKPNTLCERRQAGRRCCRRFPSPFSGKNNGDGFKRDLRQLLRAARISDDTVPELRREADVGRAREAEEEPADRGGAGDRARPRPPLSRRVAEGG